jgi:hypothetical protein
MLAGYTNFAVAGSVIRSALRLGWRGDIDILIYPGERFVFKAGIP